MGVGGTTTCTTIHTLLSPAPHVYLVPPFTTHTPPLQYTPSSPLHPPTHSACRALASLHHLTWLDLSDTLISNEGLERLAACARLQHLALSYTHVDDGGVGALTRLMCLQHVTLDSQLVWGCGCVGGWGWVWMCVLMDDWGVCTLHHTETCCDACA